MDTLIKDLIPSLILLTLWIKTGSSKEQDVCFWNTYNAICDENEVIQMEHALYGRMSVGSCIPEALRIGCQVDVLSYMDSACSGKQSCQIKLPDDDLAAAHQPCTRGLESYLQLEYKCIAVHSSTRPCADSAIAVTGQSGLLANFITERTGQGSQQCPWMIRGSPGQKIRLTLYDYGVLNLPRSEGGDSGVLEPGILQPERTDICHIYARVTEDPTQGSITICGGEASEKMAYLSETNVVHITLTDPKHSQHPAYFLLRYEIIGCLTYTPPMGAVFVQHDNDISVTCRASGTEWRVVCDGTQWQAEGNVTNCTEPHPKTTGIDKSVPSISSKALLEGGITLSQGLVIAFFLSIAVLIAVIIMVIGIFVLRRRRDSVLESTSGYNGKEHFPMLSNDQRAQQYLLDKSYTTAAHRHSAVPPVTVTPRENFPPLPLPPTRTFSDTENCAIHGTLGRGRYQRNSDQTTQSFIEQSSLDDWPNSLRSTRGRTKDHFYHELDPEHTNVLIGQSLDNTESELETAPLPDVLSASTCGHTNYGDI